jgi:anti-sigma regulatory factor (Ser/Thr protein kinase)
MEKCRLIEFWLRNCDDRIAVVDEASVSELRRKVRAVGEEIGLDGAAVESMAIVGSELAQNQLRHGMGGRVVCRSFNRGARRGLEILAADRGKGIVNPARYLEENPFTDAPPGSLQQGLASVLRLSDEVSFDLRENEGSFIRAVKFAAEPRRFGFELALLGIPHPEERISGDSGFFLETPSGFIAALSDGVGHGFEARQASDKAMALIRSRPDEDLRTLITLCDEELQGSRGASLFLLRYDEAEGSLQAVGAGDISCQFYPGKRTARFFSSTPRTPGLPLNGRPWHLLLESERVEAGGVLLAYTDGLKSDIAFDQKGRLWRKHPVLIAQHILDDYSRGTDDATILAVRFASRLH